MSPVVIGNSNYPINIDHQIFRCLLILLGEDFPPIENRPSIFRLMLQGPFFVIQPNESTNKHLSRNTAMFSVKQHYSNISRNEYCTRKLHAPMPTAAIRIGKRKLQ